MGLDQLMRKPDPVFVDNQFCHDALIGGLPNKRTPALI